MKKSKEISVLIRDFQKAFPPRKKTAHKGEFGRVFILAGSKGLAGAGLLAGMGALRSGAGLISLGTPENCAGMLLGKIPEVMIKPLPETPQGSLALRALPEIKKHLENQDVLALGPGLSQNPETQQLIRQLVSESKVPLVIDADGLNAFSGREKELKDLEVPTVLTPHPGEFKRLFGKSVSDEEADRIKAARVSAKKLKLIVVLKGAGTVTTSPDGRYEVNPTGNPGLAKGGSGDVLCGMIASFLGQGLQPFLAARLAVFVHGYAADLALKELGEMSLTAGDLLNFLPQVFLAIMKEGTRGPGLALRSKNPGR